MKSRAGSPPGAIDDAADLGKTRLLFLVAGAVGKWKAFFAFQRLLGIPVHENPSKDCAGYEIALVWKFIETKRTTTGQVEVMQHLCDGHRSPLPWIRWCDPENAAPKLVEFFFGEERVPVHLLHSEVA